MHSFRCPKIAALRFRYWSRKGYAIFAGIGKCVTIGCLRKSVVEQSLTKQLPDGRVIPATSFSLSAENTGDETPFAFCSALIQTVLLPVLTTESNDAACTAFVYTIPIYNIEVTSRQRMLPLFLIPHTL